MNFKEEIIKLLNDLKNHGITRKSIEDYLEYSENYITQQLSKGGNEKLYKAIKKYHKQILGERKITAEAALIKVLLREFAEYVAKKENGNAEEIIQRIKSKAKSVLDIVEDAG